MREKFIETIKKHKMINKGDNILIGLSGGVDSMAMLHLLLEYKSQLDFNIFIAHVNHGVREEAKLDQEFTKEYAEKLNLPFYTINVDMDGYAKEKKITSEEAGRILRYGFFKEILKEIGGGKIAVAHNLNDQAETILMRIMRGTGTDGLRGIEYTNREIIRPILDLSREELEDYIEKENIPIVQDHTNFMPIYTRNKIRLELIPYIEENFNPQLIESLTRLKDIAVRDISFLEKFTLNRFKKIVKSEDENKIILNRIDFNKEDKAIKLRLIRLAVENLLGDLQGINYINYLDLIDMIENSNTGSQMKIRDDYHLRLSYDEIIIEKFSKSLQKTYEIDFIDDIINLGNIVYEKEIISLDEYYNRKKEKNTRYFDLDKIKGDLKIRNRRPGDRFIPFGMTGSKKIKDYFIDEKIDKEKRDEIDLITDGEKIIWIVGYRTSNTTAIDDDTKRVLKISYGG